MSAVACIPCRRLTTCHLSKVLIPILFIAFGGVVRLRALLSLFAVLVAPVLACAEPAVPSGPESFEVAQKTEVPNATLSPGSYSIRILDHLRDRVILQVTSAKSNHVETTFLAIPASTMANAPVGPIRYGAGPTGKAALKGFSFPGGVAVEFVYPKNDAVSIAKANDARVMAIDPASEGRVPAPKLSQNDMQMITLWMLEPSRVGPGEKQAAIAATRYQAPVSSGAASGELASNTPPSPAPALAAAPRHHSRPVQVAQNDAASPAPAAAPARTHVRPAAVKALPHTASNLPLLWLGTLAAFAVGGTLTFRRNVLKA